MREHKDSLLTLALTSAFAGLPSSPGYDGTSRRDKPALSPLPSQSYGAASGERESKLARLENLDDSALTARRGVRGGEMFGTLWKASLPGPFRLVPLGTAWDRIIFLKTCIFRRSFR
jgi:hypothetical protein